MKRRLIPALLIALAILVVFLPTLHFPFLAAWDDPDHITANPHLALTWSNLIHWFENPVAGIYMPLTMLTYMADHALWGLNPAGYRITAMLCHFAAGLALYGCCRRMALRPGPALAAALLFVIHPQRVESVVWMSERKDVLCAALYFTSLYLYLGRADRGRFNPAAWGVYVLALLAKPMAVSLPLVLLCAEFHRRRDFAWKYYLKFLLPWLIPTLLLMAVTLDLQVANKDNPFHPLRQTAVVLTNVFWYVRMTFFPADLAPIYPKIAFTPQLVAGAALFYAALAAFALHGWKSRREYFIRSLLPLALAFGFALAPVAGMLHAGYIDHADRYSYIPSAFIWFGVMWGWQHLTRLELPFSLRYFRLLLAGYLLYLAGYSLYYAMAWRDFKQLIQLTCLRDRVNDCALAELGLMEMNDRNFVGMFAVAERFERQAAMAGLLPDDRRGPLVYAAFFRGRACLLTGERNQAEQQLLRALQSSGPHSFYKPGFYFAILDGLYTIRMSYHDYAGALKYLNPLIELSRKKKNFTYYFYSGVKALIEKRFADAVAFLEQAQRQIPDDPAVKINLDLARRQLRSQP